MGTSAACIPFLPVRQGPTALLILRQRPAPSAVLAPNSQTCTCVSCGRDQGCPFALRPRSDPNAVPCGSRSTLSRHPPPKPASARCPYAARTVSALPALDQVSAPPVVLILHSDAVATQLSGRVMPFRPLTPDSPGRAAHSARGSRALSFAVRPNSLVPTWQRAPPLVPASIPSTFFWRTAPGVALTGATRALSPPARAPCAPLRQPLPPAPRAPRPPLTRISESSAGPSRHVKFCSSVHLSRQNLLLESWATGLSRSQNTTVPRAK